MDPPRREDILVPEGSVGLPPECHKVPTHPLFVLSGMITGQQCKSLKRDGCNTNIISKDFIAMNEKYSKTIDQSLSIKHSNEDSSEMITGVVAEAIYSDSKASIPIILGNY